MIPGNQTESAVIRPIPSIDCSECEAIVDTSGSAMFSTIECPQCQIPLRVPGMLQDLFILKQIGRGVSGTVYKAYDANLQKHVAVKVIDKNFQSAPEKAERYFKKVRALDSQNHRDLVPVYHAGLEEGHPYIVMELIEGLAMSELMGEGIQMDEVTLLQLALDIVYGLRAANNIGLIHGDIKPSNIIVDKQQTAKLMDFGIARDLNDQTGSEGEDVFYVSPERIRKFKEDFRTDIYSLGATMFHALAGRPPFEGSSATEIIHAKLSAQAPPVQTYRKKVSQQTADMVARMLQIDPAKRHADFVSLLSEMHSTISV
ncbi:MAG: serine/threonine-protein kinase, partial [Verrucomicrobiota bacterium]